MRRLWKTRKSRTYCGKAISRRRVPLDIALRVTVFALVVLLALMKFPDAKAKVLGSGLFKLDSVTLKGNRYLLDSRVMEIAGIEEGSCVLGQDIKDIQSRLVRHPRIRSATVKRFLWKKIYISIEERTPIALLGRTRLLEVDEDGVVFEPIRPTVIPDLPVITGLSCEKLSPGDRLAGREAERVLALLNRLRCPEVNLCDQISELHVDSNGALILVSVHSGTPVLVGTENVTAKKLKALRVALADMQRRYVIPTSFDLRFRDQIIAKEPRELTSDVLTESGAQAKDVALF